MDFFASQDAARRKTGLLVFYFLLAIAGIVASIYAVFTLTFLYMEGSFRFDPQVLLIIAAATLSIILLGTLFKMAVLRGGGRKVAESLGGRLIPPNTTDFHEKRLVNVIEEMAIAAGVPVPPVYVMEGESGINAFAAGFHPDDAVIGVTRGAMQLLTRDELQGVMAHEFSHILNGDMRLNIRLIGLLQGILLISIIGRILLRSSRFGGRGKKGNALPLFGLALLIIGAVGVLFGRLIKSAVSRQREYLADAAAVQFTRNPLGIGGALKKLGGLAQGSCVQAARAEEASHLFFGNALRSSWVGLFSTHPPLVDRIKRIDPSFEGKFEKVLPQPVKAPPPGVGAAVRTATPPPIPVPLPLPPLAAVAVNPRLAITQMVGAMTAANIESAQLLLAALPAALAEPVRDTLGAQAVIFRLLLSADPAVRDRQLGLLARAFDEAFAARVGALAADPAGVKPEWRIPLADLALPALKQMPPDRYPAFKAAVKSLVEADSSIDLFEYTLQHILVRHLEGYFEKPRRRDAPARAPSTLVQECRCVLSTLAHLGHEQPEAAAQAFAQAATELGLDRPLGDILPPAQCALKELDGALNRLAEAALPFKKSVMTACLKCLLYDRQVTVEERELFRAIADALDCPVPLNPAASA
jgi:Zn-dependent protease with chaperone function